jgi:hypothetical protein
LSEHSQDNDELITGADLPSLLDDVVQVLRAYRPILVNSALQVYHSVLLSMPWSRLYELENKRVQGPVAHLISARNPRWELGTTFLRAHIDLSKYTCFELQFSPTGDFIALSLFLPSHLLTEGFAMIWGLSHDSFNATTEFKPPMIFASGQHEIIFGTTIWDFHQGQKIGILDNVSGDVTCMAISMDHRFVACINTDEFAAIWRLDEQQATKKPVYTRSIRNSGESESMAFSVDSTTVLVAKSTDHITSWNTKTGSVHSEHLEHTDKYLHRDRWGGNLGGVVISSSGRYAASIRHRSVTLWNANSRKLIRNLDSDAICIAFSPDGCYLCVGTRNSHVELFEVETGSRLYAASRHASDIVAVSVSVDRRLASLSEDGSIWISESYLTTQDSTVVDKCHSKMSLSVASDGFSYMSTSGTEVTLWDSVGEPSFIHITATPVHSTLTSYSHAALSVDGTRIAILSSTGLMLVDTADNTIVHTWSLNDTSNDYGLLTMSENGSVIAFGATTTTAGYVHIGENDSKDLWMLSDFPPNLKSFILAVSPSGKYLAAYNENMWSVQVWDISDRSLLETITPTQDVSMLDFAPDDMFLMVCMHNTMETLIYYNFVGSLNTTMLRSSLYTPGTHTTYFSLDGCCIIGHADRGMSWILPLHKLFDSTEPHRPSFESHGPLSSLFTLSHSSDGWIYFNSMSCPPTRLCWFPPNRRWNTRYDGFQYSIPAHSLITRGTRVAFLSGKYATVIDFKTTLDFLQSRLQHAPEPNASEQIDRIRINKFKPVI